jgi:predicted nucleotidyltransferase
VPEPELAPEKLLGVLRDHGVRYVLVGGFAAVIHGSPYVTVDVDVVPDRAQDNMRRLSDALRALNAKVWTAGEPEGIRFGHDARSLTENNVWNLVTDHGRLDITFVPAGTTGYDDLVRDATRLVILGVEADVASLADVIRSKEAAGREKDRLVLPVLRRLLEEGGP